MKNIVWLMSFFFLASVLCAQSRSKWQIDFGVRGFKYSVENGPGEIGFNPVFSRWESINQRDKEFQVSDYQPLEPLYFNMNFGVDLFIRYQKHLLIKVGYDYSNPFGIGGAGSIRYQQLPAGIVTAESKEFSYTSHQLNYFIGPLVRVNDTGAEIYMGFSPMAPTRVVYTEKFHKTENGAQVESYDKTFKGLFGSCRALWGLQVPVGKKWKIGSEVVFAFLNYMKLESGELADHSFRFPAMKWNFTVRYAIN